MSSRIPSTIVIAAAGFFALGLLTPAIAQAKKTTLDGVYTPAQAARGQKAFVKSCGGCHRDDMSGGDDSEPPLRGINFSAKWKDASVAELYDYIATNMPRSKPGSLPLEDCIDIVSFILQSNDMPAGATELTTDIDTLLQISF